MSDVMWSANMQEICLSRNLIQGLLFLLIIPQSDGTVSTRTQWSHQDLAIEGLSYKLGMIGVPIDRPADVFCDN